MSLIDDRYRLMQPLGQGGMGRVWLARDEILGRDVAIKELVPPPGLTAEERAEMRERTMREARSIARLNHPGVVRIHDVVLQGSEEEPDPWIVMEYVAGGSLQDRLAAAGRLPVPFVAGIGAQLADALRAAHAAGVVHRDIKPANVLLTVEGRAVLTDFGIATVPGDPFVTRTGVLLGSPAYLAPERARGSHRGDFAGDMWSLGATLFAAVEGTPPFARESTMDTLTALVTEPVPQPQRAGALTPILVGLLDKDPARRMRVESAVRMLREVATPAVQAPAPPPRDKKAEREKKAEQQKQTQREKKAVQERKAGQERQAALEKRAEQEREAERDKQAERERKAAQDRKAAQERKAEQERQAALQKAPQPRRDKSVGVAPVPQPGTYPKRGKRVGRTVMVVLILTLIGVATALDRSSAPDSTPATQPSAQTATPSAAATSAPASQAPSVAPTTAPAPPVETPKGLPAGWQLRDDGTGFKVPVPDGWTFGRDEDGRALWRSPNREVMLLIDQTRNPKPDPVQDWRNNEAARKGGYRDYQRVRLEAVSYWDNAADWEFTYTSGSGTRLHVLNRGFVTAPDQAYSIYWSTPDAKWESWRDELQIVLDGFVPARS